MGMEPILPVKIDIILIFDSDGHGGSDGVGMCKQPLRHHLHMIMSSQRIGIWHITRKTWDPVIQS